MHVYIIIILKSLKRIILIFLDIVIIYKHLIKV